MLSNPINPTSLVKTKQIHYSLILFCLGWGLVLLIPILPILPSLQTFMLPWRAEFSTAILFFITLAYLFIKNPQIKFINFSRRELYLIIAPIIGFILWSLVSIYWAESTKSVLHHTFIWLFYLFFYLSNRFILQNDNGEQTSLIIIALIIAFIGIPPILEYASFVAFGGGSTIGIRYSKYAEMVNVIFPLFFAWVLQLNGKKFWLGLTTLTIIELLVISSLSRAGLILFSFSLVSITILTFAVKRFHPVRKKLLVILLAFGIGAIAIHAPGLLNKSEIPMLSRISDQSTSISTRVRPFFIAVSLEMIEANPLLGVGADNFGQKFDKYRLEYAEKNPNNPNLSIAEGEIPERAHNEYFQIIAELGVVGMGIFTIFLFGIGYLFIKMLQNRKNISLLSIASLLGLTAFLVSSIVSSYSFRALQNGLIFFFVLAFAVFNILKDEIKIFEFDLSKIKSIRLVYLFGLISCLFCIGLCLMRVASVYQTEKAALLSDINEATPIYEKAITLDDENANAYFYHAITLLNAGKYQEAIPKFEKALHLGRISAIEISLLISAKDLSEDFEGAEKTLQDAIKMYPYSIFFHTRYAFLLKERGRIQESEKHLKIASAINEKHTNTWHSLISEGSRKTSLKVAQNPQMVAIMDLAPQQIIHVFLMEREIKHPEEKVQVRY